MTRTLLAVEQAPFNKKSKCEMERLYRRFSAGCLRTIIVFIFLYYPACLNFILPNNIRIVLLFLSGLSGVYFIVADYLKNGNNTLKTLTFVYCGILILSTIVNHGNIKGAILTDFFDSMLKLAGICSAFFYITKNRNIQEIIFIQRYLEVIVLINVITMVIFSQGIFQSAPGEYYYILGHENQHSSVYFLSLLVSIIRDRLCLKKNTISNRTIMLIIVLNIGTFLSDAKGMLMQVILFDVMFILRRLLKKYKWFNPYSIINVNLIISAILLFFYGFISSSRIFQYIVVNMLHKDISLESRTAIWNSFMIMVAEKPILGHGILEIDLVMDKVKNLMGFGYGVTQAHNQFLTAAYFGGILMLAVLISISFCVAKKLRSCEKNDTAILFYIIFAVSLFHWHTEATEMPEQIAAFTLMYNIAFIEMKRYVRFTPCEN